MDILFVGAGKRVEMAKLFKKKGCQIYSYELDKDLPIASEAEIILGLKWDDKLCRQHLRNLIESHNFDLVIPFMDNAVEILSELKYISGVDGHIVVSHLGCAKTCLNKNKFEKFMLEHFEAYYPKARNGSPVIKKPICGYGSKDISILQVDNPEYYDEKSDDYIYQEYITGREYTVDCYVNKIGNCIGTVPRLREVVLGGEIFEGRTVKHKYLELVSMSIVEQLGARGPISLQWKEDCEDGSLYCFEANARFCGGSPLSIAAGFDTVEYVINEYCDNETIRGKQINWKDGVVMKRYFMGNYFNGEN